MPFFGGGLNATISETLSCPAGVAVRELVYIDGNDSVDKADANGVSTYPALGWVLSKPTTTTCIIQYDGEMGGFSGLTAGATYYLSETAGDHTDTAPIAPGSVVQRVGVARDATTMVLMVDRDYVLL